MPKPLHSNDYRAFTVLLRRAREDVGITQKALAESLGEDQTYVSKCETGIRRLDVIELRAWLRALGTTLPLFIEDLDSELEARAAAARAGTRRRQ